MLRDLDKLKSRDNSIEKEYAKYLENISQSLPDTFYEYYIYAKVEEKNYIKLAEIFKNVGTVYILSNTEVQLHNLNELFGDVTNSFSYVITSLFHKSLFWWDMK